MALSNSAKILFLVCFLLLDAVAFYLIEYQPKYEQLEQLRGRYQVRQQVLQEKKALSVAIRHAEDELGALSQEAVGLIGGQRTELGDYVDRMHELCDGIEGVEVASVTPLPDPESSVLKTRDFQLNLEANFQSLDAFFTALNELQTKTQLVAVHQVVLRSEAPGVLRVEIPMRAFLEVQP